MNPLAEDLDHILAHTEGLWEEFRGQRIFITGGTGFFGCWLLESFAWANDKLGLGASALVLSRNPHALARKAPQLTSHPAIGFHVGDVRNFEFPDGHFSHVIHAATEASPISAEEDALLLLDTIIQGTHRTLEFAVACGARKFLLTSSGAVYGRQPPQMRHMRETYTGGPDVMDPRSCYGEGKRVAELLCTLYHKRFGVQAKIARCYAFLGPYMKLDAGFAAGDFIEDHLKGGPIRVKGAGTPVRSYLYAADLMIWLWTILARGATCRPYNVGSSRGLSVGRLAAKVAQTLRPRVNVLAAGRGSRRSARGVYVPSAARASRELGLAAEVPLTHAIRRTRDWFFNRATCA